MKVSQIPLKNIELNQGLYITETVNKDPILYIYDKYVEDNYWNYAYLKQPILELENIKQFYSERNISASVYLLEGDAFRDIKKELIDNGFELSYSDAIMAFKGDSIKADEDVVIKETDSETIKNDYLTIYKEVFCDEGEDVYSGLGDGYLKNVEEYLQNYPENKRYDIVAYVDDKPAGIASVLFDDKYAVIMNVAVSENFRKRGVAKALTSSCVNKFRDKILFLGTEEGSTNEEIYKKMGFETVGIGRCYKERK